MEVTFGVTLSYFLWSMLVGGVLALIYDVFRTLRRISRTSVLGVNLEDVLFFLFAGALLFWMAYSKNSGRLRWQGFLGTALGLAVYRILIKDRLVNALVYLYGVLVRILTWILKAILLPVKIIYRILAKPFIVIGWYSHRGVSRASGAIKLKREKHRIKVKCKKAEAEKRRRSKHSQNTETNTQKAGVSKRVRHRRRSKRKAEKKSKRKVEKSR